MSLSLSLNPPLLKSSWPPDEISSSLSLSSILASIRPLGSHRETESLETVEDYLRVRSPSKNRRWKRIAKTTMHLSGYSSDMMQEHDPLQGALSGVWKSKDGRLSCGFVTFMGKRLSMEDRYDIREEQIRTEAGTEAVYFFGIFDGHGGPHAAEYLKDNLFANLIKHPKFITATDSAIRETYNRTDGDFLRAEANSQRDDGSTASTAIFIGNRMYIANVGDSRAVISKAGEAVQLSDDHKPNRTDERKRIENAGGIVMWAGTWRVGGVLAMSRAFGDRLLKQFVVADPEIRVETVDERLEFLVIASDGLWDSVSNEDAVKVVASETELDVAARNLARRAVCGGSGDNITCIVVRFNRKDTTASNTDPVGFPVGSQSTTPFPPTAAVDSSSAGIGGVLRPASAPGSSSVGSADPLLHTNAGCSSASSLGSILHITSAGPSAASTDPPPHAVNATGAGSTSSVNLNIPPAAQVYPSTSTNVVTSSVNAAGSSISSVDPSFNV